jgi:hypothetical protein
MKAYHRFRNALLAGVLVHGSAMLADSRSIRDVDFKNFTYPFVGRTVVPVPNRLRWMPLERARRVTLHDGGYTEPCDGPRCPSLALDQISFVNIDGLPETAIVVVTYYTGGAAHWQYVYVIALSSGEPQVVAWLETGSRADKGLRRAAVDRGDLLLVVNDPRKRTGDCCSTGTIRYRYKWNGGSFRQAGVPVRQDDAP